MKQSAVDFLIRHLQKSKDWQRVLNEVSQMSTIEFDLINQAKAMEKEQIIDAFDDGNPNGFIDKDGEQYYNQTFKSE